MNNPVGGGAQLLAEACADFFAVHDRAARRLNIEWKKIAPGQATLTMRVVESMLNAAGMCQGGVIFTLADTAFGYACNSENILSIANGCSIEFLAPGRLHDTLTAQAKVREIVGRNGVYDVQVKNQHHETIALFRGKCRRLNRPLLPEAQHSQ